MERRSRGTGRPTDRLVTLRLLVAVTLVVAMADFTAAIGLTSPSVVHPQAQAQLVPADLTIPPLLPTTTTTTAKPRPAPAPQPAPRPKPVPAPGRSWTVDPVTRLAALTRSVTSYQYPGGPAKGTVPGTWYGYQSILPIVNEAPGWLEVRLAQRPNMSVTWVHAGDVTLSATPYYTVLDLATTHLYVYKNGQEVFEVPAGVGTSDVPTPTGIFFIAFQAPPPNSGYGPFVLVTAAHSNAISDWEGQGDAIVGIHGPITSSADAAIGRTGARVSHGCIRLHNQDVSRMAVVPLGTPLYIVAQ